MCLAICPMMNRVPSGPYTEDMVASRQCLSDARFWSTFRREPPANRIAVFLTAFWFMAHGGIIRQA